MGGTSRLTRLLLAAFVAVTGVVAVGSGQAGATGADATPRVVGGGRVSIADHGYTVYLATADGFQYCGGTLVDSDKVVTAAHCTVGKSPSSITVVGGREDKESNKGTVAAVRSIWIHPDFTDIRSGADISMLTLSRNLPYEQAAIAGVKDAALYQPGVVGLILGWGRTSEDGNASRYLLAARVPLVSDRDCQAAYPAFDRTSMVCAGLPQGGVDTCQGDSGGPLVVDKVLVGITSWGEGCAEPGLPGVYTRVAAYSAELTARI